MKVTILGANQAEIEINDSTTVLQSYETPVAAWVCGVPYRTNKRWSVTTSKHITKWFGGRAAQMMPQSFFDALLDITK